MMKLLAKMLVVTGIVILPGEMALAHNGIDDGHQSETYTATQNSARQEAGEMFGSRGRNHAEDKTPRATSSISTSTHEGGYTSNRRNAEEVRGQESEESHERASMTASTTRLQRDESDENQGHSVRGNKVQNFLAWIFGQPGSVTGGEIKAQINASTSLGSSTPGNAQGLGFFARLFGFFGRHDN